MPCELKELREQFNKLMATLCDGTVLPEAARELRIMARDTCLKLYKGNMDNAAFWKGEYQKLMEVEKRPEVTRESKKITVVEGGSPELPPY